MKMILVFNLIGSLIHESEAYKPVVVIHGLKEKVSDLDFLRDNIVKVILIFKHLGPGLSRTLVSVTSTDRVQNGARSEVC